MSQQLESLEEQRSELIGELAQLGDFQAGSITGFTRRCGKQESRCARKRDSDHGPINIVVRFMNSVSILILYNPMHDSVVPSLIRSHSFSN